MVVYDIFERVDGEPGEGWIATVSNRDIAVDKYCQTAINVIRPRQGTIEECDDLD